MFKKEEKLDFKEICRLEENLMLKRLSLVLKSCSTNKSYEKEKGNMSFERKLRVYEGYGWRYKSVPK